MNSSKRENLLNLALDATEEERLQSLNLNVGGQSLYSNYTFTTLIDRFTSLHDTRAISWL